MSPGRQNTDTYDRQMQYTVFNMERAIRRMDESKGIEQMVLLFVSTARDHTSPPSSLTCTSLGQDNGCMFAHCPPFPYLAQDLNGFSLSTRPPLSVSKQVCSSWHVRHVDGCSAFGVLPSHTHTHPCTHTCMYICICIYIPMHTYMHIYFLNV